jgi:transcription elongation factor Elf1
MDKYVKKWTQWCDSCGHGFKVAAEEIQVNTNVTKISFIGKLLGRKPKVITEDVKPKPSPCPVCGKTDNVTVIKLQEDKVYVPDNF